MANKVEGTSRTYGQHVVFGNQGTPTAGAQTTQTTNNSSNDISVDYKTSRGIVKAGIDTNSVIIHANLFENNGPIVASKQQEVDPITALIDEVLGVTSTPTSMLSETVTVLGSKLNNKEEIRKALLEATKIDNLTTLKSLQSEKLDLNFLQQPELQSVKLVYNFFDPTENDTPSQEDLAQDPLLSSKIYDVPRYVEITWNKLASVEPLSDDERLPELVSAKRDLFYNKRGVFSDKKISFKGSPTKKLKDFNLLKKDGLTTEIVDIHSPEKGFESTENYRMFRNSIFSVVNIRNNNPLTNLPFVGSNGTTSLFSDEAKTNRVQVNFSAAGLKSVLDSAQLTNTDKEQLTFISDALDKLNIQTFDPTGFVSIPELAGIEYVGYVVDKERFIKETGEWSRIHEFKLIGAESDTYRDTRIVYGSVYRYRIRSVAKVTLGIKKSTFDESRFRIALETAIVSSASKKIKDNINTIVGNENVGLQTQTSSGLAATSSVQIGPFSKVNSNSDEIKTVQTTNTPANILSSRNKNATADLGLLIGQLDKEQLREILNKVSSNFLTEDVEYRSYYFESELGSAWKYVFIEENVPPPYPQNILIVPNSKEKKISIMWLLPSSEQRDISFVNIYKRKHMGEEWSLLGTFPKEITLYEDKDVSADILTKDVTQSDKYIYALTCIDVHGLESFLSAQIQAELNPRIYVEKEERKLKWMSAGGLTLDQTKESLGRFIKNKGDVFVAKHKVTLKPALMFGETSKDFLIRVTSLDNGEQKEYKVTLKNESKEFT
jgi:hypothetical protein